MEEMEKREGREEEGGVIYKGLQPIYTTSLPY